MSGRAGWTGKYLLAFNIWRQESRLENLSALGVMRLALIFRGNTVYFLGSDDKNHGCHPLPTESLEDLISGSAATADAVALSLKPALKEDIAPSGMPKKQSKQAASQVLQGNTTNAATLASTLSVKVRDPGELLLQGDRSCSWPSCMISPDPDLYLHIAAPGST